mgnify:CR=1 FL=1
MRNRVSGLLTQLGLAILVLAVFWLTGYALVRISDRLLGGWPASQVGILIACGIGIYLAFRLHVRPVAYLLAGQLAFGVAELCLHSIYGIRSVQGGPTHFAVMLAGTLGVLFGWYLGRRPASSPPVEHRSPSFSQPTSEAHTPHTLARDAA